MIDLYILFLDFKRYFNNIRTYAIFQDAKRIRELTPETDTIIHEGITSSNDNAIIDNDFK